jgi:Sec7-like guanine-nucleotide exchange factor
LCNFQQFKKNQHGLNDGKDFSDELLKQIYEEIKDKEVIMPEEHEGQLKDNYQWTVNNSQYIRSIRYN